MCICNIEQCFIVWITTQLILAFVELKIAVQNLLKSVEDAKIKEKMNEQLRIYTIF